MLAMKAPAHPTGIFGENREAPAYFVSPLKINYAANYLLRRGAALELAPSRRRISSGNLQSSSC